MGIETALIGGALGAAGSYFGNQTAASASKAAAAEQAAARVQNQQNAQPYLDAGKNALGSYMNALGLNGSAAQSSYYAGLKDDPAYARVLDSGNDAIMKRQAALGLSGNQANTLSAVSDYSGGLRNQFDQQRLQQIGGVVDTGRMATGALAGTNTQGAATQGQMMTQAGILQGQSYNALGQAVTSGIQNYGNMNGYNKGLGGSNNLNR